MVTPGCIQLCLVLVVCDAWPHLDNNLILLRLRGMLLLKSMRCLNLVLTLLWLLKQKLLVFLVIAIAAALLLLL